MEKTMPILLTKHDRSRWEEVIIEYDVLVEDGRYIPEVVNVFLPDTLNVYERQGARAQALRAFHNEWN